MSNLSALTAGTWNVDGSHSTVEFSVRHLMIAKVRGRFTDIAGSVTVGADPLQSSVAATVRTASVSTNDDGRDGHLRSADFFDVAKYPTITFKSTSVKEVAKGKLEVTGDFTLHGVTKRITIPITNAGTQPGMQPGSVVAGFIDGAVTINRNDYGIKYGPGVLGDDVAISLNIEAGKKYKVAGWAPVAEEARTAGNKMVWEVVEQWLKAQGGKVGARKLNAPKVSGVVPNPGYVA